MRQNSSPTGICVIRVETRGGGLLITIRTNPDIERIQTERVAHTVDTESTIQAVRKFLSAFTAATTGGGG